MNRIYVAALIAFTLVNQDTICAEILSKDEKKKLEGIHESLKKLSEEDLEVLFLDLMKDESSGDSELDGDTFRYTMYLRTPPRPIYVIPLNKLDPSMVHVYFENNYWCFGLDKVPKACGMKKWYPDLEKYYISDRFTESWKGRDKKLITIAAAMILRELIAKKSGKNYKASSLKIVDREASTFDVGDKVGSKTGLAFIIDGWRGTIVSAKGKAYRVKITGTGQSSPYIVGRTYDFVESEIEGWIE
ncbi:MAG: hypothetical protein AAF483_04915 [Planctomycetota bacterium]